jgi:ubiquinone/menaquinone biosynthesis C-methylase UbiE
MNNPLGQWQGQFGDEYVDRNQVDYRSRVAVFHDIIPQDVHTVLEVGCNRGHNLTAIKDLGLDAMGVEPNHKALAIAREKHNVVYGTAQKLRVPDGFADLAFTCGVLMHIPPGDLDKAMAELWRVAKKYVLIIEYQGNQGMIEYRGNKNMLWKRKEYVYPLGKLIAEGEIPSFDNDHFWLYEK